MDTIDWRTQFPPDSRGKIINSIMKTLQKHLPFSGPEGTNELRRIASRFEEKIFSGVVNQTDYFRKISMKMLSMETDSRNETGHLMDNDYSKPSLTIKEPALNTGNLMDTSNRKPSLPNEQPTTETGDWRTHLPPDSRQKIVNRIMETLDKHFQFSGPEGINELMRIASLFEEKLFNNGVNQTDYLRKISMKMLPMVGPIREMQRILPHLSLPPANNSLRWIHVIRTSFSDIKSLSCNSIYILVC